MLGEQPLLVITCYDTYCPLHFKSHSADGFALGLYHPKMVKVFKDEDIPNEWSVWVAGGMQKQSRNPPKLQEIPGSHLVLNVPGPTLFAAKSGLWNGLVKTLGRPRAREICPETWPRNEFAPLKIYAKTAPNVPLILKFGHRQKNMQTLLTSDPKFDEIIDNTDAKVVQKIQMDAFLLPNGAHVAFRTYTLIRCLSSHQAEGILDFNSPAYLNKDNSTIVSSGYTPTDKFTSSSEFITKYLSKPAQESIRLSTSQALEAFLTSFGPHMCHFPSPSHEPKPSLDVVFELFGFDWLPIQKSADEVSVKLLETNRFPDLMLHTKDASEGKDVIKVCSYARRIGDRLLEKCPPADELRVTVDF